MITTKENRLLFQRRVPKGQIKRAGKLREELRAGTQATPLTTAQRQAGGVGVSRVGVGRPETTRIARPEAAIGARPSPSQIAAEQAPSVPPPRFTGRRGAAQRAAEQEAARTPTVQRLRPTAPTARTKFVQENILENFNPEDLTPQQLRVQKAARAAAANPNLTDDDIARIKQSLALGETPTIPKADFAREDLRREAGAPLGPRAGAQGIAGDLGFNPEELGFARTGKTRGLFTQPQQTIDLLQQAGIDPFSQRGSDLRLLFNRGGTGGLGTVSGQIGVGGKDDFIPLRGFRDQSDVINTFRQFEDIISGKEGERIETERRATGAATAAAQREAVTEAGITPGGVTAPGIENVGTNIETTTSESFAQSNTLINELQAIADQNPDVAPAILSQIAFLRSGMSGIETNKNAALAEIGDGKLLADSVAESKRLLAKEKDETDALLDESKDIQLESSRIKKELQEIEKNKFEINQTRIENEGRENLVQQELQNRRLAAKLGINFDTGGLEWMQKELRRGNENLALLEQMGDLESSRLATEIGAVYDNDVKLLMNRFETITGQNNAIFRKELESLDNILLEDAKDRRKSRREILEKAFDRQAELEKDTATRMHDITKDLYKNSVKGLDPIKTVEWAEKFQKNINSNPIIKDGREMMFSFKRLSASYFQSVEENKKPIRISIIDGKEVDIGRNFSAIDQALNTQFNKLLDPGSVVRESEFARTAEGVAAINKLLGFGEKIVAGGLGITQDDRNAVFQAAQGLIDAAKVEVEAELIPYMNQIKTFNAANPAIKISASDVLPAELVPLIEEDQSTFDTTFDSIFESLPELTGTQEQSKDSTTFTPNTTMIGKRRTDRHNNPTAFTTTVAGMETSGLVKGVDYEVGDPFPNNPNAFTARLLGDPIKTTIKLIDNIGFFTAAGGKRWEYIDRLPDHKKWGTMNKSQKADFIKKMYRMEGGNELDRLFVTTPTVPSKIIPTPTIIA